MIQTATRTTNPGGHTAYVYQLTARERAKRRPTKAALVVYLNTSWTNDILPGRTHGTALSWLNSQMDGQMMRRVWESRPVQNMQMVGALATVRERAIKRAIRLATFWGHAGLTIIHES